MVAVVLGEHDAETYLSAMVGSVAVSIASFLETMVVVESYQGPDATRDLSLLLDGLAVTIRPSITSRRWQRRRPDGDSARGDTLRP
ncbi:MAG: type II toxin-antitoxin system VapC family toxin [Lapillicoccus sp.]